MALQNLIERLQLLELVVSDESTSKRMSTAAAFAVIAEYKTRIFTEGLDSEGNGIGRYSETPFYQNPFSLTGVPTGSITPQGKDGKPTFKNGKPKKTRYLPRGYKELRELTGRQSEKVDLNFSGSLERSIRVVEEEGRAVIQYTNADEALKMEGNEQRFGTIISEPTEEEREIGVIAAAEELRFILESIE